VKKYSRPHRHFVFSIPKMAFFQETLPEEGAVPGAVIAIQSFGDFLGFNPHLHILCSDGCFYGDGMFRIAPRFETKQLEEVFPAKDGIFDRHNVFPARRRTPFKRKNHGRADRHAHESRL
jgi:hypothetical protein